MNMLAITEAVAMAQNLPILLAIHIYGTAWAAFIWALAKAIKALREAFKGVEKWRTRPTQRG